MNESAVAEHSHPPVSLYVTVIVILAAITAFEIVIILPEVKDWYRANMTWFIDWVAPILIAMSVLKFFGVVMFFMHLKQDRGVTRLVFFAPLVLALLMVLVLMLLFGAFYR